MLSINGSFQQSMVDYYWEHHLWMMMEFALPYCLINYPWVIAF